MPTTETNPGATTVDDPTPAKPLWFRVAAPSLTDLIFVVLFCALSFGVLSHRLLRDGGTGWHIRTGQWILTTHSIPRVDSFSATMQGHTWYAWEWLYDASIAATHGRLGLNGVVWFTALVIAATFALALKLMLRSGTSLLVAIPLLILAFGAAAIHLFARPHVVSWLLTVIWFALVNSVASADDTERRGLLFWLPIITLLWVNVHGGFLTGFVISALYLIGGSIEYWQADSPVVRARIQGWLGQLSLATTLAAVATLVNPYGYHLHAHIYQYLTDTFLMNHVEEFLSPNFHDFAQQCFACLLLITMVAMIAARGRVRASHLFVVIFAAYSGLYASRNLPISSLLLILVVGPVLTRAVSEGAAGDAPDGTRRFLQRVQEFSDRMGRQDSGFRGHVWPIATVVLVLAACFNSGRLGTTPLMNARFDFDRFPVKAVDFLAKEDAGDPVFSPDSWGGYLIYRLYPGTKVFVDDRHDLYGDEFLRKYLTTIHVEPGWEGLLDQLRVNWVLLPANGSLTNMLKLTPQWKVRYEDRQAAVFQRVPAI